MKQRAWFVMALLALVAFAGIVHAYSVDQIYPYKGNNTGEVGKSDRAWKWLYVYDAYILDTTDFNDGSATNVKVQVISANSGDTIVLKYCTVTLQ